MCSVADEVSDVHCPNEVVVASHGPARGKARDRHAEPVKFSPDGVYVDEMC